jgi:hypothetical protein
MPSHQPTTPLESQIDRAFYPLAPIQPPAQAATQAPKDEPLDMYELAQLQSQNLANAQTTPAVPPSQSAPPAAHINPAKKAASHTAPKLASVHLTKHSEDDPTQVTIDHGSHH